MQLTTRKNHLNCFPSVLEVLYISLLNHWTVLPPMLLLELPLLPAHGALVLGLLGAQPLHDAVDVEAVTALT